jgi:hypothetical protein
MNEDEKILQEADDLLGEVKKPDRADKKPSNFGLWFVLAFVNIIGITLDVISAVTVYTMTGGLWLYSILTFLAGVVPFVMWELAYVRPYASFTQRKLSIMGVLFGVLSILTIGILSALANARGLANVAWAETAVLISLVLLALLHGSLAGIYFYTDQGILAHQRATQNIAYYEQRDKNLDRAEYLLGRAAQLRVKRQNMTSKYKSPAALQYLLSQLSDEDGDGIPDILEGGKNHQHNNNPQPKDTRLPAVQFASTVDGPPNSQKPRDKS